MWARFVNAFMTGFPIWAISRTFVSSTIGMVITVVYLMLAITVLEKINGFINLALWAIGFIVGLIFWPWLFVFLYVLAFLIVYITLRLTR